jgi:hypothetical protein
MIYLFCLFFNDKNSFEVLFNFNGFEKYNILKDI